MKIVHIGHSGFWVELDKNILIFDYFQGEIPFNANNKKVTVFSSHMHRDHFTFEIFNLLRGQATIDYVLSKDIKRKYNRNYFEKKGVTKEQYESIQFIGADEEIHLADDLKIETLKSTDSGVAFVVTCEEKTIYHAGDLNIWTWDGQNSREQQEMRQKYFSQIDKMKGRHFDVAFVVLDSRQSVFHEGMDYFMRNTETDMVVPMHYWEDRTVIDKMKALVCSSNYKNKIREL